MAAISHPGATMPERSWPVAAMAATVVAAAGVLVVVAQTAVRHLEAQTAAGLADLVGLASAKSLGASVIFPMDGHFVGFNITPACTVALLVLPFFLAATLIIASRRVSIRRTVGALVVFSAVVFAVNQIRLAVVIGAMKAWGFESGYERSHVFIGTVVSTVGVLGSMVAFIYVLLAPHRREARRG